MKLAVQIAPTIVVSSFEVLRQQQPQAASFLRGLRWWHRLANEPWRERRALSAAKHLPILLALVSLSWRSCQGGGISQYHRGQHWERITEGGSGPLAKAW